MHTRADVEVALVSLLGDSLYKLDDEDKAALTDFAYTLLWTERPVWTQEKLINIVIMDNALFAEALLGNKIRAIANLRGRTGAGLADAKNAVESAIELFESHRDNMLNPSPF